MNSDLAEVLNRKAKDIAQDLIDIRRQIHRNPELGFEEKATADLICRRLEALGIRFRAGVGKTGVVGLIEGGGPGKTIGLRADMDALPVQEEGDTPYASQIPGVMHACGHDAHVACLLGAAMVLAPLRNQFHGNIKLVFQPAEEIDQGAKAVIADGGLENPRPNAFFGLHVDPELPVGCIGLKNGPVMAAIDNLKISVTGKGGHGALPHRCVDAIVAASSLVMNLQTAVSRETDPMKPTVVSIGTFNGGRAENIIASRAELSGTVRTIDPEVHQRIPEIIERICKNTAATFGAGVSLEYQRMIPPLVNSPQMVDRVAESCTTLLGPNSVVETTASMVGEDFAFFLEEIPGAYFFLGAMGPAPKEVHGLHSSRFEIDERALPVGAALLAHTAISTLQTFAKA